MSEGPNKAYNILANTRSPYIFVNGETNSKVTSVDAAKDNKSLSKNDVNFMYFNNYFTLSDLHIAKMVAENVFATIPILQRSIANYHERVKDSQKVAILKDVENIRYRLKALCKAQILYKVVFASYEIGEDDELSEKNPLSYFVCSPHGYNYIKRLVNFDRPYDDYVGILSLDQVFRYLTVIDVCQGFYTYEGYKKHFINNQEFTVNVKTGRKFYQPYGIVLLEKGEEKRNLIVEPFFLTYNKSRISAKDYKKELLERFANIREYLSKHLVGMKVIFACEDLDAIKTAVEMVKQFLPNHIERIFFTIDKAVTEDKEGVKNVCLQYNGENTVPAEMKVFES